MFHSWYFLYILLLFCKCILLFSKTFILINAFNILIFMFQPVKFTLAFSKCRSKCRSKLPIYRLLRQKRWYACNFAEAKWHEFRRLCSGSSWKRAILENKRTFQTAGQRWSLPYTFGFPWLAFYHQTSEQDGLTRSDHRHSDFLSKSIQEANSSYYGILLSLMGSDQISWCLPSFVFCSWRCPTSP